MKKDIKIKSPEEIFNNFLNWLDQNKKIAFLTALIIGFITHIIMITDLIMGQDALSNSIAYTRPGDWELTLGRWGIALVERLNYFIAIPAIATVTCILIMAIVAVFVVDIFEFKKKTSSFLTASILVLTPTFTTTLIYIYTSVAYCFNLLITVLAIWFTKRFSRKKIGFILSTLCIMFSFSIYQSYVGVTIGICMMLAILELIKNNKEIKDVIIDILKVAGSILLGGILYYIITMILLKINGLELATYKNANGISILGIIKGIKTSFVQTYLDFGIFFFGDSIVYNTNYKRDLWYLLFWIILSITTILGVISIKDEKKTKIKKVSLIFLIAALLPVGLNVVDILMPNTTVYLLTGVQIILVIPFALSMLENIEKTNLLKWGACISLVGILGTYYLATNASYTALKLTYNQALATTIRIMDRMETTPGYEKSMPVLFGGIVGNNNYPRTSNLYGFTLGFVFNNVAFHGTYGGQLSTWQNYLKIFLGVDVNLCTTEDYYRLVKSKEFEQMNVFPGENSIKVIDNILVVKLNEEPPLPY